MFDRQFVYMTKDDESYCVKPPSDGIPNTGFSDGLTIQHLDDERKEVSSVFVSREAIGPLIAMLTEAAENLK